MSDLARVKALLNKASRLLAGERPQVQGAVLADLLAMWLAGHRTDSQEGTERLRDEMLEFHLETVRKLVPENAKAIDRQMGKAP